jgi:GT2 family glycosyltransferase
LEPELSIIIVSYNVRHLLLDCIQSVIDTSVGLDYEIIVVDNASSDGSAEAVRDAAFPIVQMVANKENVGFAQANNQGYKLSRGEFILLLNPDTLVKRGAITNTLDFLKNTPDAGIAGCRLLNPDGTLQKSIGLFPSLGNHFASALFLDKFIFPHSWKSTHYRGKPFEIDYCMGAFMLVRREALGKETLLNPKYFMYSEEKDLSLRLKKKGWKTYFVPYAEIIHLGEQSVQQAQEEMFLELMKSQVIFFRRHYKGLHLHSMIWSFYLYLLSSFAASSFFIFTRRGYNRFKLFGSSVAEYPGFVRHLVKASRQRLNRNEGNGEYGESSFLGLVGKLARLPLVSIRMRGGAECEYYYKYFTMPHPKYKLIQNKRWGVTLMALPDTFAAYLKGREIQALRTNRKNAMRVGCRFDKFSGLDKIEDIMAINLSMEKRQGWPMPKDYLVKDEVIAFFTGKPPLFGVFDSKGVLKAYAYVLVSGEVGFFVRILGHGDDLGKGIMYYLVSEVVREMIELKGDKPKWLMYDTYFGATPGLKYFKERCGFEPYKVNWFWQEEARSEPSES